MRHCFVNVPCVSTHFLAAETAQVEWGILTELGAVDESVPVRLGRLGSCAVGPWHGKPGPIFQFAPQMNSFWILWAEVHTVS